MNKNSSFLTAGPGLKASHRHVAGGAFVLDMGGGRWVFPMETSRPEGVTRPLWQDRHLSLVTNRGGIGLGGGPDAASTGAGPETHINISKSHKIVTSLLLPSFEESTVKPVPQEVYSNLCVAHIGVVQGYPGAHIKPQMLPSA